MDEMSFEQAYSELEAVVHKLEAESLPLTEAIDLYRQGMELAQYCHQQLDQAELLIQALTDGDQLIDFEDSSEQ